MPLTIIDAVVMDFPKLIKVSKSGCAIIRDIILIADYIAVGRSRSARVATNQYFKQCNADVN